MQSMSHLTLRKKPLFRDLNYLFFIFGFLLASGLISCRPLTSGRAGSNQAEGTTNSDSVPAKTADAKKTGTAGKTASKTPTSGTPKPKVPVPKPTPDGGTVPPDLPTKPEEPEVPKSSLAWDGKTLKGDAVVNVIATE